MPPGLSEILEAYVIFPQPAREKAVTVGDAGVAAHLESALLRTQQALFSLPVFSLRSLACICGHSTFCGPWDTFLHF